jgi:hypothetical protein
MDVSVQFHTPGTLSLGTELLLCIRLSACLKVMIKKALTTLSEIETILTCVRLTTRQPS